MASGGVTIDPSVPTRTIIRDTGDDEALVSAGGSLHVKEDASSSIAALVTLLLASYGVTDAASPSSPGQLMHGWDGSNRRNLLLDSSGKITEVSAAAMLTALQIIDDMIGTPGGGSGSQVCMIGADDGSFNRSVLCDSSGRLLLGNPSAQIGTVGLVAGAAEIGKLGAGTAEIGQVNAEGDTAHDAADAGNPVKVGFKAITMGSTVTGVANSDRVNGYATRNGTPFFIGGSPDHKRETTSKTGVTTDAVLLSVASGEIFVLTGADIMLDGAGATDNVQASIEFDDTTDKRILEHPGIKVGSGVAIGHAGGIVAVGGDGHDVLVTCSAPGSGGEVVFGISGFITKSGM